MNGVLPLDVAVIVWLVLFAIARILTVSAAKGLPPVKKAELIDRFSGISAYGVLPMIALAGAYFLAARYTTLSPSLLIWSFIGLSILVIAVTQVLTTKKLRAMQLGPSYMQRYALARASSLLGFFMLVLSVIPRSS